MREQLYEMGEKIVKGIGEATIKVGEKSVSKCIIFGIYEPKVSIEVLKENIKE
jgi:cyclic lactone autoinducer peptide